jgi:indolepyruvate ferredoxin oxidoreductase
MSALADLVFDAAELERAGIRILKLAMVYPIEASIVEEFVEGLEDLIVIEEKRSFIELQLRELLFYRDKRPKMLGKQDAEGRMLFPATGELSADVVAQALARHLQPTAAMERRLEVLAEIEARFTETKAAPPRAPSYCSGCPHNRSTYLLEGQIAGGGIGCHGMAAGLEHAQRGIAYIAQMGGEGAAWIGTAPFSGREHIFQNIGDGTYFHSGRMAVSAAVAAGVNITYKILFNGGVAMTGGQAVAGGLPIPALTRELEAAGVKPIMLLTDDLSRYEDRSSLAGSVEVKPREDLEETLAALEKVPGVSAMIYDQLCAAEKRRRRNRGKMPQPVRRILINERVCEGCGDCVVKSNCVSLHPVETEFGPKTRIHQSSCNADYTCALGDCPSFVSVMVAEGTGLKRKELPQLPQVTVEDPTEKIALEGKYHILMPGVGGTGVVTVNALLATAAMLDGHYVSTLDQTGMAKKGGAVVSHLTISPRPIVASHRVNHGRADLLLGFDLVGAAGKANLNRADPERTVAVVNSHNIPTGDSIRKGLTVLSTDGHFLHLIRKFTRADRNVMVDASGLAESLFGGHLQTNIFLLGVAYQAGLLPITAASIEETIRLNGVAIERNLQAFRWGRKYQQDPGGVLALAGIKPETREKASLPDLIESRVQELTTYQSRAYAETYRQFVEEVQRAEQHARPGSTELTEAVARHLYKLMAYKDEYEVARLLTDPAFDQRVRETFEAPGKAIFHLHPPLLRSMGLKQKLSLGPWFRPVLRLLASMKSLRGTPLDLFGWAGLRREERTLIAWYQDTLRLLLPGLNAANLGLAAEIARLPDQIRGYEHINLRSIESERQQVEEKLADLVRESAA